MPELGPVTIDVAYGGMIYAIADAAQFHLPLEPGMAGEIARIGEMVKAAAAEQLVAVHPENPDICGVTISQLSAPPKHEGNSRRNAVIVSTGTLDWNKPASWTGALDRSPCGTGTCARMATLHARGALDLHEDFRHEGVLDTVFTGRLVRKTKVGPYDAVVPAITGRAWITGINQLVVDAEDPFPEGFVMGDIWGGVG